MGKSPDFFSLPNLSHVGQPCPPFDKLRVVSEIEPKGWLIHMDQPGFAMLDLQNFLLFTQFKSCRSTMPEGLVDK
ncbi:MAG: hypothetical protein KAX39_05350 [candidate division Zixibacteria bacterium]|nr:hypothetical protein [candidate division Zixibacteria bacterium]